MLTRKRLPKRERSKKNYKKLILVLFIVCCLIVITELIYFNLPFKNNSFISPIGRNLALKTQLIESNLNKNGIAFNKVSLDSDGSYRIYLKDQGEVILSSKKDITNQVSSLQLMLSRLTIEGKKLKILDFRFNRPVVSF